MIGPMLKQFLDSMPQTDFASLVKERDAAAGNLPEQQRLSIEERRALTREAMREDPLAGTALAVMAPLEQVGKGMMAAPVVGPYAEKLLKAAGLYEGSRSGFHNPGATIGGTWTGALQGLRDRGMFGK